MQSFRNTLKGLFTLSIVLILSSCNAIFTGIYGVKSPKTLSTEQIKKHARKQNIPLENVWVLDSTYRDYLKAQDTNINALAIKNHAQPLQALYYHKQHLFSFHANCYAGGFPNLSWNHSGAFNQFPPATVAPIDSLLPLNNLRVSLKALEGKKVFPTYETDTLVIVFWNRFMGRQSKRLVKLVKENAALGSTQKPKIIYVNNDNFFAKYLE